MFLETLHVPGCVCYLNRQPAGFPVPRCWGRDHRLQRRTLSSVGDRLEATRLQMAQVGFEPTSVTGWNHTPARRAITCNCVERQFLTV